MKPKCKVQQAINCVKNTGFNILGRPMKPQAHDTTHTIYIIFIQFNLNSTQINK